MRFICLFVSFVITTQAFANEAIKQYEQALVYFNEGKFSFAEIEIKNSLKLDIDYLPSRLLLAKILVATGNFQAAEKEFEQAQLLRADSFAVVLPLVEVKLMLHKYEQALSLLAQYPQLTRQAKYFYLQGSAYKALQMYAKSRIAYEQVLAMQAGTAELYTALADLWYQQEQVSKAQTYITTALTLQGDYIPALLLSSEIEKNLANYEQAHENIAIILTKDKHHKQGLFAKANLLLAQNKLAEALSLAVLLRKLAPENPYSKLLYSTLVAQQGDIKQARRVLNDIKQQLSGLDDSHKKKPQVLLLLATVDFINQNVHSAKRQFLQYIELYGNNSSAHRYLAIIAFRQKNMDKAQFHIEKALAKNPNEVEFYLLAAQIYQQRGLATKQLSILARAHTNFPDNQLANKNYVAALLAQKFFQKALAILSQGSLRDDLQNKTLLAFMQLESGLFDQAKKTTQELLDDHPDKVEVLQLAGELSLKADNDSLKAEYFFEQALTLDEHFSPALFALAGIYLGKNALAKVESYYQQILDEDKHNAQALQLYADLAIKQKRLHLAIKLLTPLFNSHDYQTGRALLTLYIATGQTAQAQVLLTILEQKFPLDQALLLSKSRLQAQLKQNHLARKTLNILFGLVYDQPSRLAILAHSQLDLADVLAATKTINRIKKIQPNSSSPYLQARLYLAQKEYVLAEQIINKHRDAQGKNLSWLELNAQLYIAQKKIVEATRLVEALFQQSKQRKYMQILAQLYVKQQQQVQVVDLLSSWLEHTPNDEWAVAQLSSIANNQGNNHLAIKTLEAYPKLIKQPAFLNNLANYYFHKYLNQSNTRLAEKDKNKALRYAKQAFELAPHIAEINDTLGWIYINIGQLQQGLSLLREASARDVSNGEIHYHLAFALAELGNLEQAKTAFEQAVTIAPKHALRDQVSKKLN